MAAKKPSRTVKASPQDVSMSDAPSSFLKPLLQAIGQCEGLSGYDMGGDENAFHDAAAELDDATRSASIDDVEQVAREIFYSPKDLLQQIHAELLIVNPQAASALDVNKGAVVFNATDYDQEGGQNSDVWLSNIEKGWLFKIRGSMGSYCDDNYDVTASYEVETGMTPEAIQDSVLGSVKSWGAASANEINQKIAGLVGNMPASLQEKATTAILKEFEKLDIFAPIVAKKSAVEIESHLDTSRLTAPARPKKL